MQDAISLFSSFLLSGLQQYHDVDHYHQFLTTPSNNAHRTTMSSTSCILLSSVFFSTRLLWWSQAISVTWFQKLCQSQRITIIIHPQGISLWTMCSEDLRNNAVVFSLLKWAVTQKLSLFHYKLSRTTDNQEFDLHSSNVFILNCHNFSARYHFKNRWPFHNVSNLLVHVLLG
jgi:hypothetical protein